MNHFIKTNGHKDTFTDELCEINEIYKILVELDENNAFSNLKSNFIKFILIKFMTGDITPKCRS